MTDFLVVVKGGGDIATGVAHTLFRAGMKIVITEIAKPTVIRRNVSFAESIFRGEFEVEGITAKYSSNFGEIFKIIDEKKIPVLIDPKAEIIGKASPHVVVDAIMAKKNLGTKINDAPIVIGLGPSFKAGLDVHVVIETKEGPSLGKLIFSDEAEKDTGIPPNVSGYTVERVLKAPCKGVFKSIKKIGDFVKKGQQVALVDDQPVNAEISGVVRGLIYDEIAVTERYKIGEIDPSCQETVPEYCFTISDHAKILGESVLKAILSLKEDSIQKMI